MGFDFHKNRDRVGGVSEIRGGLNTQIALGLRPKATKGQFRWSHLISQTIFYNFNLAKTTFVIYIMPQPDEGSSGAVYLFNAPQAEAKEILADDNFKSLDITFHERLRAGSAHPFDSIGKL